MFNLNLLCSAHCFFLKFHEDKLKKELPNAALKNRSTCTLRLSIHINAHQGPEIRGVDK